MRPGLSLPVLAIAVLGALGCGEQKASVAEEPPVRLTLPPAQRFVRPEPSGSRTPPTPETPSDPQTPSPYRRALELQKRAEAALDRGEAALANELLLEALYTLGSDYLDGNVVDDTGMNLVRCSSPEREGKLKDAFRCRSSVLVSRLGLCERNPRCFR